jgi:type III pantothenate kinase
VTQLLVDVGNTRVKWTTCDAEGRLMPQRAAEHAGWTVHDWERALFAIPGIERVMAASVAGAQTRHALVEAASRRGIADVHFATSVAAACGVRNAYRDPRLLGVDRWVAMIGAYHLRGPRACCVVDVGTATTVDAVKANGAHLGGFIVPGPHLMVRSLLTGTSDLAAHSAASRAGATAAFADNTREAIERGCRLTLGALVDRAYAELVRVAAADSALVLTGGAAGEVLPYVLAPVEHVPDLVLYGLSRLARSGP